MDVEKDKASDSLFNEAESLVRSMGFQLVDFCLTRRGRVSYASAVIYSRDGTGIDECAAVHRLLHPRLQVLLGEAEPSLEVSSPGMEREFRSQREYLIFQGRGVKAFSRSRSDWVRGILSGFDGHTVVLSTESGDAALPLDDIAKARLDYSQEVR